MGIRFYRWNPVSVIMLLVVVAGIYGAYKFAPVYFLDTKVQTILDSAKYEAAEIDFYGSPGRADRLIAGIRSKLLDLGLDDETTDVYFNDDNTRLQVDYTVVVEHPFDQTTVLERSESLEIPNEN